MNDTKGARLMRGLVKTVFIGCYAAFMWASIHHIAAFFDNYEQAGGSSFGSYMLAGAIDITALVSTTGLMFFRKSMPRYAVVILWIFIAGLALYSFLINWEYAAHFQSDTLLMQATGQLQAVYDTKGELHYVPVMQLNTWLLYANPALASCFTIFALIYSVVGEFFGTKAPTADELTQRLQHLQATAPIEEQIRKLEETGKGPGLVERAKRMALEVKAAAKEVTKGDETTQEDTQETGQKKERITDKLAAVHPGQSAENAQGNGTTKQENQGQHSGLSADRQRVASHYPNTLPWLSASKTTVFLNEVVKTTKLSRKMLNNRVKSGEIQPTKNEGIVYKDSLVKWMIDEIIPKESQKKPALSLVGTIEEVTQETAS